MNNEKKMQINIFVYSGKLLFSPQNLKINHFSKFFLVYLGFILCNCSMILCYSLLTELYSEFDPELTRTGRQLEQGGPGRQLEHGGPGRQVEQASPSRLGQVHSLPTSIPGGSGPFRPDQVHLGPGLAFGGPSTAQVGPGQVHLGPGHSPVGQNPAQVVPGQAQFGQSQASQNQDQVVPGQAQAAQNQAQAVPGQAQLVPEQAQLTPGHAQVVPGTAQVVLSHIQLGPGHEQAGPGRNFQRFVMGQSNQGNTCIGDSPTKVILT